METKGTPGKRRWWVSLSQMKADATPPFYTRGGVTSLRQLLFDTRCDCIAIGYFLFLIAATIAAAAPMTANIETVTPVCCSIVGSSCFPFSAPFTLPSSLPVAFPSRLSSGDAEPFEPFPAAPLLTKLLAVQARYFNAE